MSNNKGFTLSCKTHSSDSLAESSQETLSWNTDSSAFSTKSSLKVFHTRPIPLRVRAFTLAEVLITLSIIGVVAMLTIPSVIINSNQQEYKANLQKAVSALGQAITMNVGLESTHPGDMETADELLKYFTRRMSISKVKKLDFGPGKNWAFYTTDGMRFEMAPEGTQIDGQTFKTSGCTVFEPCLIIVDVNGDKKPNPVAMDDTTPYQFVPADGNMVNDIFTIMITDTSAIPYGAVAQKAMYESNNK